MSTGMTLGEIQAALTPAEALAFTALGEAANQPIEGQIGVMMTVRNRAKQKDRDFVSVCFEPLQYSCWNPTKAADNVRLVGAVVLYLNAGRSAMGRPLLRQLLALADLVVEDILLDNTLGSTHYITRKLFGTQPPPWVAGKKPVAGLGDHVFFNGIPWS